MTNQIYQRITDDIAEYGWHVVNVLEDADGPPFSYTIGLFSRFGHPELLLVGLPERVAHPVLNLAGERILAGDRFVDGSITDEVVEGYSCVFRDIPPAKALPYLGQAAWYHWEPFPALQIIYPDRHARWPWDPAVDPAFRKRQPVVADAPIPHWASRPGA